MNRYLGSDPDVAGAKITLQNLPFLYQFFRLLWSSRAHYDFLHYFALDNFGLFCAFSYSVSIRWFLKLLYTSQYCHIKLWLSSKSDCCYFGVNPSALQSED